MRFPLGRREPAKTAIWIPGFGEVEHPALGAGLRRRDRERRRYSMRISALSGLLAFSGFFLHQWIQWIPFVTCGIVLILLGYTIGQGQGWQEGFRDANEIPKNAMMEVETVLNSLSDEDREKIARAFEEQDEDAA